MLLPLITLFLLPFTYSSLPVCIIGAGPSGLSTALYLKDRGYDTIVFEKQNRVGGRCITLQKGKRIADAGAYFANPFTQQFMDIVYRFNQPLIADPTTNEDVQVVTQIQGNVNKWMDYSLNGTLRSQSVLNAWLKYFEILKEYPDVSNVKVLGLQQPHPELNIPFVKFLEEKDLMILYPFFITLFSNQGYGSMDDIPTLYGMRLLTEDLIRYTRFGYKEISLFPNGWQTLWQAVADSLPDVRMNIEIRHVYRSSVEPRLYYSYKGQTFITRCSSVIFAFPQLYDKVSELTTLSRQERELFSKVVIVKYFSAIGISRTPLPKTRYLTALKRTVTGDVIAAEPKGEGEVVAIIQQSPGIFAIYSWIRGDSFTSSTEEESKLVKERVKKDVLSITGIEAEITDFFAHDYFPHVQSKSLDRNWHIEADRLQGNRRTFWTGTLFDLDTVSGAVRSAYYLVNRFYPILKDGTK